jgi:hypothetical protein
MTMDGPGFAENLKSAPYEQKKASEPVVYTTTDKAKRDELYEALRNSDLANERQATKFSGQELVPGAFDKKGRQVYRSTWSVSHP